MSGGTLFTVSAPSGAGKTSLVNALLRRDASLRVSVSHTTRAKREGEIDGQDYCFIDQPGFDEMVSQGAFLEHACVFGHCYGTSQAWVEQALEYSDVILEIDWQGAAQVRQVLPKTRSIFILPPSRAALSARLQQRGQDDSQVIAQRMQQAISEMSHYHEAHWLVVNDDFEQALNELHSIIISQRLQVTRQSCRYSSLLESLLAQ